VFVNCVAFFTEICTDNNSKLTEFLEIRSILKNPTLPVVIFGHFDFSPLKILIRYEIPLH
jgi:hypothetical protein